MIELNLSHFVSICLIVSVVGILGAWLIYGYCKKFNNIKKAKEKTWHCSICTHIYIDNNTGISACPKCGSYNKKEDE